MVISERIKWIRELSEIGENLCKTYKLDDVASQFASMRDADLGRVQAIASEIESTVGDPVGDLASRILILTFASDENVRRNAKVLLRGTTHAL